MSKPRPQSHDPDVVQRHMALIRERVAGFLRSINDEVNLDTAMQDVQKAMHYESDGYRIAQSLESLGWEANAELVSVMDSLALERSQALAEAEQEWVKSQGTPKSGLVVGAQVRIIRGHPTQTGNCGEVLRIDDASAKCLVMVPDLGHVRTGQGTHGFLINIEDVEIVQDEASSKDP